MSAEELRSKIREIPDFPKPGILFYDITTLLRDGEGFGQAIDALASPFKGQAIDAVVGDRCEHGRRPSLRRLRIV